jgi:hypothetical protein
MPTELQGALVDTWRQLLDGTFEILDVEIQVANSIAAGTLDRTARTLRDLEFTRLDESRVMIPKGTVIVLDIKTGQLRIDRKGAPMYWAGYRYQIGHYANSVPIHIDPDDPKGNVWGEWAEGRAPSTEHAIIAHLDIAGALETGVVAARLVYVDLTENNAMTEAIEQVRYWRKQVPFSSVDGQPDVVVEVGAATTSIASAADGWLQERIDILGASTLGRELLLKHWPKGVKPPKDGITDTDFAEVQGLCDRVEAQIGAPFGESQPGSSSAGRKL